jgi:hypothetical protein
MLGWVPQFAARVRSLPFASQTAAEVWAGWASEIVADAFALAHTGFASLIALADVVDGDDAAVFQFIPGDPHPIPFLRVELSAAVLRRAYGGGPWDDSIAEWRRAHPVSAAPRDVARLVEISIPMLPRLSEAMLWTAYRGFGGKSLADLIDPDRVSPHALRELDRAIGKALYKSPYWLWTEAIRVLALTGAEAIGGPEQTRAAMKRQEDWMLQLGAARHAA